MNQYLMFLIGLAIGILSKYIDFIEIFRRLSQDMQKLQNAREGKK